MGLALDGQEKGFQTKPRVVYVIGAGRAGSRRQLTAYDKRVSNNFENSPRLILLAEDVEIGAPSNGW